MLLIIVYTGMFYVVGPYADTKDPLPVLIQAASSGGRGMLSGSRILKVEQLGKKSSCNG